MKKQATERIDIVHQVIHNKLPDHEERLKSHCERVQREYHKPAKLSLEVKEKTTPIIEPKTKVKNDEGADQRPSASVEGGY